MLKLKSEVVVTEADVVAEAEVVIEADVVAVAEVVVEAEVESHVVTPDFAAAVTALAKSAGLTADQSLTYLLSGNSIESIVADVFSGLKSQNKPVGLVIEDAIEDENAKYRKEFKANIEYYANVMSEDQYISSRRIDDGVDSLI